MNMKALHLVSLAEGVSLLLLLFVAMPLKYYLGHTEPVFYVGMAHGVLFLAFLVVLLGASHRYGWSVLIFVLGLVAAVLPFGTFVFDHKIRQYHARRKAAALAARQRKAREGAEGREGREGGERRARSEPRRTPRQAHVQPAPRSGRSRQP